jgi:hypothetical protein
MHENRRQLTGVPIILTDRGTSTSTIKKKTPGCATSAAVADAVALQTYLTNIGNAAANINKGTMQAM